MLTIYHLEKSRSERIIWLAEELGLDYQIEIFERTSQGGAPPEYKALHPLGRAPLIKDGDLIIAESGAIIDYLSARYGRGKMVPAENTSEYAQYLQWLHYAEGSLMAHFLAAYFMDLAGDSDDPMHKAPLNRFAQDIGYVESVLAGQPYLAGENFTGADVAMGYGLKAMRRFSQDSLPPHPHIDAYLAKLAERPAYRKAETFG